MELEQVKQFALTKFAGDETAAQEFVDGFVETLGQEKYAGIKQVFNSVKDGTAKAFSQNYGGSRSGGDEKSFKSSLMQGLGKGLGEGMGGIAIATGIQGVANLAGIVGNNVLHYKFLTALEYVIASNRLIREAGKDKVRQYGETIFKYAPNVATDPNLLTSVLANAIHGDGIDPITVKTLTELESRYRDNTTFSPKSFV
jgi:hypothetical protein